jgi:hypothetical protein
MILLLFNVSTILLGFGIGGLISIATFSTFSWAVSKIIPVNIPNTTSPKKSKRSLLLIITVLKYPVIAVALYLSLKYLNVNVFALVIGLGLAHVIMILKLISIHLIDNQKPLQGTSQTVERVKN